MTRIALAVWLASASFLAVDADEQPLCRERCQQAYAEELAACGQARDEQQADECREAAQDRHQECIDRCND